MPGSTQRNRLMPWVVGLVIILVALGFVGWQVAAVGCGDAPTPALVMALVVMPAVYLGLMYLTLAKQE